MRGVKLKGRAFLVSDDRVYPRYGERAEAGLREGGFEVARYVLPSGESTKQLGTAQILYDWLAEERAERQDAIVALGGGVVGDVAGFVAATFLRGMPLVQVPTTVLAQIDSSIGGKVAVNHPKGKNLIGAFYPAALIVGDAETLASLSPRELASGWAEAIKCALILDAPLLDELDAHAAGLCDPSSDVFKSNVLPNLLDRCAQHKLRVVAEDLREQELRMILNYGHTTAHAIEAALDYEGLLHGEAVSIGMVAAASIAVTLGLLDEQSAARQNEVIEHFGLPTRYPAGLRVPDVDVILDRMTHDKKVSGSMLRWILLDRIGHARIESGIPMDVVRSAIERLLPLPVGR
jgi:3-dehydroquinate synthase